MHAIECQRRTRKPFGVHVSVRGKLRRRAEGFEVVTLRIERRELHRAPRSVHCCIALALEGIDCAPVEPAQGMTGVGLHSLIATLAGSVQVLQQMTVDEAFGRKRKRVRRIPVQRGVGGAQGLGSLARAILGPAARHPQDEPVSEPCPRGGNSVMPVDQFLEKLASLQELVLA